MEREMDNYSLGWWNRLKYRLLGSPEYCGACGKRLETMSYKESCDPQTGKTLTYTIALSCSSFSHGHTHIYFSESI